MAIKFFQTSTGSLLFEITSIFMKPYSCRRFSLSKSFSSAILFPALFLMAPFISAVVIAFFVLLSSVMALSKSLSVVEAKLLKILRLFVLFRHSFVDWVTFAIIMKAMDIIRMVVEQVFPKKTAIEFLLAPNSGLWSFRSLRVGLHDAGTQRGWLSIKLLG